MNRDLKSVWICILGGLGVLAVQYWLSTAQAEVFPSKPVKIVAPFPISGPTDIRGTTRVTKTYKLIAENAPPAISDSMARMVAPLATMPFVLMVHSSHPADGVRGLAAWLKVRPGEVNFGSSGEGSTGHLAGELFRRMTGTAIVHVPFNGGLAGLNGLATGQVSLMFAALPLALPYLTSEQFATRIHTEADKWAPLLRASRLPLENGA